MDSAVSGASTMLFLTDTPSPLLEGMAAQQQHTSRRRGPVKRQSSCLSSTELMAQTADFLAQQQLSWVQLWPNQSQHVQLSGFAAPWPYATDAAYGMPAQQLPLAASMLQQPQLQASSSGNMLNSFGLEGHMGPMQAAVPGPLDASAGAMPAPVLGPDATSVAAAYDPAAAVAATATMRAPQHRLPKRRASAPHLAAAAAANQPMFKCVPHTGGDDCQCTQCLCARTDALCQRLIAQRTAQAAAPQDSAAAAAAAAAAAMQPASQYQPQQQQVRARGQSPVHGKRRSLELPPNGKVRRSPDSKGQSPAGSPGQAAGYFQQQQRPACMPYAGAQPSAQALMPRAASGPLNGQFQQLSVSAFEGTPAAYAAASAAASQQQMYAGAGAGQTHHSRHGSADSEEAAVDQELEQLLAGVAWPALEVPARQPAQPQRQPQSQPPQQPMQQAMASTVTASTVPATAAVVNGYAAPACASLDPADLLDLDADLRLPSFDKWGNAQGPASNTLLPELDPDRADLGFLAELLDNNPEEASLMDLLLN